MAEWVNTGNGRFKIDLTETEDTESTKETKKAINLNYFFDKRETQYLERLGFTFTLDWIDHLFVVYHCDKN